MQQQQKEEGIFRDPTVAEVEAPEGGGQVPLLQDLAGEVLHARQMVGSVVQGLQWDMERVVESVSGRCRGKCSEGG